MGVGGGGIRLLMKSKPIVVPIFTDFRVDSTSLALERIVSRILVLLKATCGSEAYTVNIQS